MFLAPSMAYKAPACPPLFPTVSSRLWSHQTSMRDPKQSASALHVLFPQHKKLFSRRSGELVFTLQDPTQVSLLPSQEAFYKPLKLVSWSYPVSPHPWACFHHCLPTLVLQSHLQSDQELLEGIR